MRRLSAAVLYLACLSPACLSPAWGQVITTIAGTDWLFPGDGVAAVAAPIGGPLGMDVATGPDGSFYIADSDNQMVMRVGTDGILHVIAGNGFPGHWGDGGLAINAALLNPAGVAVDASGNVYIAEYGGASYGGSIRMVTPAGIISTIAGSGRIGYDGDGGPAILATLDRPRGVTVDLSGNIYFADQANGRIRKFRAGGTITTVAGGGTISGTASGSSADGGAATLAQLGLLTHVTVDTAGRLYFVDGDLAVRRVTPDGILSTVAGGGQSIADGIPATQSFLLPSGIACDAAANLFIADYATSSIRKVTNGVISTIAGGRGLGFSGDGGPASQAYFNFPNGGLAIDFAANVFVADNENLRIREISGGMVQTVAGNGQFRLAGNGGPAVSATLYYPTGVRTSAGSTYVAEGLLNRVRKIAPDGTISIFAGSGALGYSGDNGPATSATLAYPSYLAVDPAGNVYVSETDVSVIRKIDTNQIITTFAGTGFSSYSGDGGLATKATLYEPAGLDFDGEGNLWFADSMNHAIRMIAPSGAISTIAGNGMPGYSGDGGPASQAQLNMPEGLRVFAPGTSQEAVYFSDTGNNSVRRIRSVGGTYEIDTVAGSGRPGYSGDRGQATRATLNYPLGLAFDSTGNLYIADHLNTVVRQVTPGGVISTVAGNGVYGFSGDGAPAARASLEEPYDLTFDSGGNLLISDFYSSRIRKVLTAVPGAQANPTSLAFTAPAGSSAIQQTISVTGTIPSFPFGASISQGAAWLTVSPSAATAPAGIQVTANPAALTPGSYNATVQIQTPYESPTTMSIPVTFTVTQPGAPSVAVAPSALRFQFVTGASASLQTLSMQTLSISNAGGGSLTLSVKSSTGTGSWLSASAATASVGPYGATPLQIRADPAGMSPGTYSGTISIASTIASANPPQSVLVPITMIVSAVPQSILIPQSGLTFFAVQGGGSPPPQTFNILNAGQGLMSWTTSVSTQSGGKWLIAFPGNGTSDPSSAPQIRVTVNPGSLGAGIYFGSVQVTSQGANNSPQYVSIVLNVLPPGSNIGPLVEPAGMIFVAPAGGESPGSRTVTLQSLSTTPLTFTSAASTSSGGNWLTALPAGGTVTAGAPVNLVVQPIVDGLAPGVYQGTLALSFSDGSVRTVMVVFVVTGVGPPPSPPQGTQAITKASAAGVCPSLLKVVFTLLSTGSAVAVGFPGQVAVQVVDDCGNPLLTGNVSASFSNGDPPILLSSLTNGNWAATWTPLSGAAQATVTATAVDPSRQLTGTAQVKVGFQQFAQPPVVGAAGLVNAASLTPQAPLAPGTVISVFGSNLADIQQGASGYPLPTALGGSSLIIAGVQAPLLFSSGGQMNAVIPYGIQVNAGQQMVISRGSSLSVAQAFTVAPASPAIFSADGSGTGQGTIYVANSDFTQTLADAGHPAKAGDYVVIYCTGLGEVTPGVAAGAAAPLDHVTSTVNPVTVMIGGVPAPVAFAGLTPGFAGLYQVNAIVPQGVAPGSGVVVTLAESGQVSPPVTMAVR